MQIFVLATCMPATYWSLNHIQGWQRQIKLFTLFKIDDTVSGRFHEDLDVQKQRAYVHLALPLALKASLPLPGSYFSDPLAAPSSSGCFCGRGAVLETRLPFIALNVTLRSLGSIPPTHTLLLAMAQQEAMRFFPLAFLQMDNTLPAVLGALQIEPEASQCSHIVISPEEGLRILEGSESLWSPSFSVTLPSEAQIAVSGAVRGLLQAQQRAVFYWQVVLISVVSRAVCWWPHEIAVVL